MEAELLEKIEPLLMDVAAGAATNEITLIVEALAANDHSVHERIATWRILIKDARQVMTTEELPTTHTFPPSDPAKIALRGNARLPTPRHYRLTAWTIGLAACLAIGIYLGQHSLREKEPPQNTLAEKTTPSEPHHIETTSLPLATTDNFWSVARLRALTARRKTHPEIPPFDPAQALHNAWLSIQQIGDE